MKRTICGLLLAMAFTTLGCAQTFARHDLFQRSDFRIGRAIRSAERTCQERQPKNGLPSAEEYEQCVLETLRNSEAPR